MLQKPTAAPVVCLHIGQMASGGGAILRTCSNHSYKLTSLDLAIQLCRHMQLYHPSGLLYPCYILNMW